MWAPFVGRGLGITAEAGEAGLRTPRISHDVCMDIAAAIILVLLVLVPALVVLGLFVWAARKDGQEDRALQARAGIRRRRALGR